MFSYVVQYQWYSQTSCDEYPVTGTVFRTRVSKQIGLKYRIRRTRTMIQDAVDFRVILVLGLVVACGVAGCSISQSLSLSLSPTNGGKSLECHLCPGKKNSLRGNFTFTLTRNGEVVKFRQLTIPRTWYALERKKNNTGRWRCEVKEFPDLWAEYDLQPPIPTSPAEKEKDTEASVPASTMSTRILLTVLTAALLLIICVTVICVTTGFCIMRRWRRPSSRHQHHKDSNRSDNFPLTENISSDLSNPKSETDTEVSYVELEIIRDPFRKPSRNYDTIYANIM